MGGSLVILGGLFLLRRHAVDPVTSVFIFIAGIYAILWKEPALIGFSSDEFFHIGIAEPVFLFFLSGAIFLWAYWLFEQHVNMLEDTTQELGKTLDLKETLLDILGHDVRNPLATAQTRAHLIGSKHPGAAEDVAKLQANLQRAAGIIDDSILYSQLSTGGSLDRTSLDVCEIVQKAVRSVQTQAEIHDVDIQVEGPDELHLLGTPLLSHAIHNLLDNAIKWSPPKESVEVRIEEDASLCRIQVCDHGPGIPPEDRARIFDRFELSGEDGKQGTGLGLAIVRRIVTMHGGSIQIEETAGGGCTFVLELPRYRDRGVPVEEDLGPLETMSMPQGGATR